MLSKTRVKNAFSGSGFDRLPMWYGAEPALNEKLRAALSCPSDEALMRALGVDFRTVRPRYVGPPMACYKDGTFETIWGVKRGGGFWGTALNAPLAHVESAAELEAHAFPDPNCFDVAWTDEELALSREYCMIGGEWAPFWHEAHELVGIEKMLMDFYLNPGLVEALLERCLAFHLSINERAFAAHAKDMDIYWFANDYGTSRGLLMSPELWRRFLKPLQAKLCEQGHRHGLRVAMHSCGDISAIIPDLIEIGVEILNPIQISCPGMEPLRLKRKYGSDLIFFGGVDYNELLTHGTPMQVREGVRRMIDILGGDGRYIVAPSHDLLMAEVPAENMLALYEEAVAYSSGMNSGTDSVTERKTN